MMRSRIGIVVVAFIVSACGSSPAAPTPAAVSQTARWQLTGVVQTTTGSALAGATVMVVDGPDAGTATTTSSAGGYTFLSLQQAGFTLRVTLAGYATQSVPVTLTSAQVVNVTLQRIPSANLTSAGDLIITPATSTLWNIAASVINQGDGCATEIAGTATIRSSAGAVVAVLNWAVSRTTVLRAGESLTAPIGQLSSSDLAAVGASGTYSMTFTFKTGGC